MRKSCSAPFNPHFQQFPPPWTGGIPAPSLYIPPQQELRRRVTATPMPFSYIRPRLNCETTWPWRAASSNQFAATALSWGTPMPAKYKFPKVGLGPGVAGCRRPLVPKHGLGRVGVDPAPGLVQQADVALGGVVPRPRPLAATPRRRQRSPPLHRQRRRRQSRRLPGRGPGKRQRQPR